MSKAAESLTVQPPWWLPEREDSNYTADDSEAKPVLQKQSTATTIRFYGTRKTTSNPPAGGAHRRNEEMPPEIFERKTLANGFMKFFG